MKSNNKVNTDLPKNTDGQTDWKEVIRLAKSSGDNNLEAFVFGKTQPSAVEFEVAIIGACLMDNTGYPTSASVFMGTNPFYVEKHEKIWSAMRSIAAKHAPIDILTVTEELRRTGDLEGIGGSYTLVEMCNKIGSAANIEYHSRIVLQKYVSREMIKLCSNTMKLAYADREDVFDLFTDHLNRFGKIDIQSGMLAADNMTHFMSSAMETESSLKICGDFLKKGDITFLFAEPKLGKSIFAVQKADAISKGESLFGGLLENQMGAQKVLYFDFELNKADWKSRYSVEGSNPYDFKGDNFIRVGEREDFVDYDRFAQFILFEVQQKVAQHQPDVLVIDNITYMASGSTSDAEVAMPIMRALKAMNKKYGTTILILAHTPKRLSTQALTRNDLGGSSHLTNFCTNLVAIGKSNKEKGTIYIKHIFSRTGKVVFDDENVIHCKIEKSSIPNFLQFSFLGLTNEDEHLASFLDKETQESAVKEAAKLFSSGRSLREVKKDLNLDWSITTLKKRIDEFNTAPQYEFQPERIENENIVMMSQATEARRNTAQVGADAPIPF